MYLLIQSVDKSDKVIYNRFTFHNVSINSYKIPREYRSIQRFTFHNVSINSLQSALEGAGIVIFTFHNVSINSLLPFMHIILLLFIYIP